jgi:hypothetical protein
VKDRVARIRFTSSDLRMIDAWANESGGTRSDVIRSLVDQENMRRAQLAQLDRLAKASEAKSSESIREAA